MLPTSAPAGSRKGQSRREGPPYSTCRPTARIIWGSAPDPIELAFSKLKRLLRAAAARTADALCDAIGAALGHFTPAECANYLRHCGYAQSAR